MINIVLSYLYITNEDKIILSIHVFVSMIYKSHLTINGHDESANLTKIGIISVK